MKNVKGIFSSEAFVLVKDQIAKAREDIAHYQALFEKLQVELLVALSIMSHYFSKTILIIIYIG